MSIPWVGVALITEGMSDDRFLPGILRRSVQERCGAGTEVPDPRPVRVASGPGARDALVRALTRLDGSFNLVAFHRDGGCDPDREHERWFVPFQDDCALEGRSEPLVPVIPVQETEAWALADGNALREVLGVDWSEERLGLPRRAKDVEGLPRAKETLKTITRRVTPWDVSYLTRLGDCVSLDRLRELPAFNRWEDDLAEALRMLPGFTNR